MARSPACANLLARHFNQSGPNQAWVSDITYIRTRSGWLYLAVMLDLYAQKVVGWAMAPTLHAERVRAALQLAIAQRQPAPGLIVHSDKGSQYASALQQTLLARYGLVARMSRQGNCWDNAVMERFFLNLKTERVWQRDYANHVEAMTDIAHYIVGFYTTACDCNPNRATCHPMPSSCIGNQTTSRCVRKNLTSTLYGQQCRCAPQHLDALEQFGGYILAGHQAIKTVVGDIFRTEQKAPDGKRPLEIPKPARHSYARIVLQHIAHTACQDDPGSIRWYS